MGKVGGRVNSTDRDGVGHPGEGGQKGLERLRLQGCPREDLPKGRLGGREEGCGGLGEGGGKVVPDGRRWMC